MYSFDPMTLGVSLLLASFHIFIVAKVTPGECGIVAPWHHDLDREDEDGCGSWRGEDLALHGTLSPTQ